MENKNNEEVLREKSKKYSLKDGVSFSVMDGFGLRYITPFALAMGAGNAMIGVLNSLPNLLGTASQLISNKVVEKTTRKKLVLTGVIAQGVMWLPLILIALGYFLWGMSTALAAVLLLVFYSLLAVAGAFVGPAWNSWMKDLVNRDVGAYFGRRSKFVNISVLLSMLAAGFILDYFKKGNVGYGFLILFSIAVIGRFSSAYFLSKKYEPPMTYSSEYYFSFLQFVKKMRRNNFGRFVIFFSLISFATAIASPFFSVYMLKNLSFNYYQFTLITVTSIITTVLSLSFWGRSSDKYGNLMVMKVTGWFVFLIPVLWAFSPWIISVNPKLILPYLVLVEALSGFLWAGLNLSSVNFIYDAVTRERMALCVSYNAIIAAFGTFLGALIGGYFSSDKFGTILGFHPIIFIFLLSATLRILVAMFMLPRVREVRPVEFFDLGKTIRNKLLETPKHLGGLMGIRRAGYT